MRRTYEETKELVAARVGSFVNGELTEAVLRASLKAMGLLKDEIEEACIDASREFIRVRRTHAADPEIQRMKASIAYIKERTK